MFIKLIVFYAIFEIIMYLRKTKLALLKNQKQMENIITKHDLHRQLVKAKI